MFKLHQLLLAGVAVVLIVTAAVHSQDQTSKPGEAAAASSQATADEIARWIADLDADEFQTRQSATAKLIAAGKPVIDAVTQAAEGDSLEVTTRAVDVLAKLREAGNAGTKSAAEAALKKLAASKNANAARRAEAVIAPPEEAPSKAESADPFGGFPLPPGFPRPKIGGFGFAGPGISISVSSSNGNKKIDAREGDRRVQIEKNKDGRIELSVTEKKDGKEETKKYKADSEDELKKNSPEAYELFKKYDKGEIGGAFGKIRIGGFGGGFAPPRGFAPPALPGLPAMPKIPRIVPVEPETLDKIDAARKELQSAADQIRELAKSGRLTPEAAQKLAEEIDAARKKIEEAQRKLGR